MSEVISLEHEKSAGRILLWGWLLCLFLFLGMMYFREPGEKGEVGRIFPLFSQLASKMDAAAQTLRQGSVCQVFFWWDNDCAEPNSDP